MRSAASVEMFIMGLLSAPRRPRLLLHSNWRLMPEPPQPEMHPATRRADSYLELRQWFGAAGALLPFVLVLGHAFLRAVLPGPPAWRGWDLQDSMSSYYYTDMRNVFVGSLCAIGAFLLSYKGEGKKGVWIAGLCAIGAGLFPIRPPNGAITIISGLHFSFAGVLYLTLAYLAIVRFPVTDGAPSRRLGLRNRLCRICGWTIVASMLFIAIAQLPFVRAHIGSYRPGFCLESLATVAYGISWLTRAKRFSMMPRSSSRLKTRDTARDDEDALMPGFARSGAPAPNPPPRAIWPRWAAGSRRD
jgi:hypothetical protein